jgi:DnaK suppressor protein
MRTRNNEAEGIEMTIKLNSVRLKLEQIHQQLSKELELILADDRSSKEQQEANSYHDRVETAMATSDLERRIALKNQKTNNLAEIEHALHKLEEGTYGICDSCGQPIERERLEALPYASLCMGCKAKDKKMNKNFIGHNG